MTIKATVTNAVELLNTLTAKPEGKPTGTMNPSHIQDCKGIMIQHFTKMGAGVGFQQTEGFVMLKTADGSWSAPSFISAVGVSLGITVGYTKVSTLIALHSDKAVERTAAGPKLGIDFNLAMFPVGMGASGNVTLTNQNNEESVGWAVSKGLIADISLKGSEVSHDNTKNASVYGDGTSVPAILDGSVPRPREFEPLYNKLAEIQNMPAPPMIWLPHATTAAEKGLF